MIQLSVGFRLAIYAALGLELDLDLDDADAEDIDSFQASYDKAFDYAFDRQFRKLEEAEEANMWASIRWMREVLGKLKEKAKDLELRDGREEDYFCLIQQRDTYNEEEVSMLLDIMILASYHTSAVTVAWTLYLLSLNPQVQRRLAEEVRACPPLRPSARYRLSGGNHEKGGEELSIAKVEQLPYLHAVIAESLRVVTPGTFAARELREDISLCQGVRLRKGQAVLFPLQDIHLDPRNYLRPTEFDPTRFLGKEEDGEALKRRKPSSCYVPFGFGARACPGERFAWAESKVLLFAIMQHFNVSSAPPSFPPIVSQQRFVQIAKDGIHLTLKPHS